MFTTTEDRYYERRNAEDRARATRANRARRDAMYAAIVRARQGGICSACIVGAVSEPCTCAPTGDHGPAYTTERTA